MKHLTFFSATEQTSKSWQKCKTSPLMQKCITSFTNAFNNKVQAKVYDLTSSLCALAIKAQL